MKTETKVKVKMDPVALVKEIHGKVLHSSDDCIKQAKEILGEVSEDKMEDMKRIAALNFDKAPEVIKAREFLKTHGERIERAKIAQHFQTMYPGYKYIFREDMDKICEEYGLILGADKHYKGVGELGIPERSLKQIINFKLRKEDELFWKGTFRSTGCTETGEKGVNLKKHHTGVYDWVEITREEYDKATQEGKNLMSSNKTIHYQSNKNYTNIGAPAHMFDMEGKIVEGNELKEVVEFTENCDPVCLKSVKYGYLILSVWGEEIAIQALQNEKMN
jgi:hypothetical protein